MRRLGVAILVHNVDLTGGMERQARHLAQELAASGARVWLISSIPVTGWLPRPPRGWPFLERRGRLAIVRVPLSKPWRWAWCVELYGLAAVWLLARHAPALDAIYAVQWRTGVDAERVARVLDRPFFVKFAGGGQNGDFAGLERSPGERAPALAALARAEGLVCISPEIESEALAAGLRREQVVRIPNGVDLSRFKHVTPEVLPGPEGSEHVLFVGALRREKRIPDLVRAFAAVARARPRARLAIAGDGPEEAPIRAAIHEAGLDDRVALLGRRGDIPALLAAARVFVLTTESEGLSNALLEAMASGTPIVATDVAGNRAVVENEQEALLVALEDAGALAGAIGRLLDDRVLAERLARAAQAKVARYDLPRVAGEYATLFRAKTRPAPSSAAILARYLGRWGGLGASGIALGLARYAFGEAVFHVKRAISTVVVALKRAVGVEGELLRRPERGPHAPS